MTETVTRSEAETIEAGRALARELGAGSVVLLSGPLGAGKTAFVRGLAAGLGCDPADVSSPTFTLMQEYDGNVPIRHVDLYRLSPIEVDDLGIAELEADGVVAVEWPERWRHPPPGAVHVAIDVAGASVRRIRIEHGTANRDASG